MQITHTPCKLVLFSCHFAMCIPHGIAIIYVYMYICLNKHKHEEDTAGKQKN